jgi:2,3-bisphosphoglycerate-dependent phosphoglycerate mutase
MPTLVMMRHGESEWNRLNLFQGWVDIPLSTKGIEESLLAGEKIAHIPFDIIFVSTLIRAQMSGLLAMTKHRGGEIPVIVHEGEELAA